MSAWFWRDGRRCAPADWLPVIPAVRLGDGLLETVRVQDGAPLYWHLHHARILQSAERACDDARALESALDEATRAAFAQAQTLPCAALRVMAWPTAERWVVCVSVHTYVPPSPSAYATGVSLGRVPHPHPQLGRFGKTTSRDWTERAKRWAQISGFDAPMFVCKDGFVIESSDANIVWFDGGRWHTPTVAKGALQGTTAQALIERGITLERADVTYDNIKTMKSIALLSSLRLAIGVRAFDGVTFEAPDEAASTLRALLLS